MKTLAWALSAAALFSLASINDAQRFPRPERPDRPERAQPAVAAQILRQPALSPDGKHLAFIYDGDLWTVASAGGDARRLTITADNEGSPCFSPDGRTLAFRSRRYGSDDIFLMPAQGGEARRITFSDAAEDPCCWTPDGKALLFSSGERGRGADLWAVRADGSEPWPITDGGYAESEGQASFSPSGRNIAYVRRPQNPFYRRGYSGTADSDIWLCEFDGTTTRNHRRLTQSAANDSYPRFLDDDSIAYVTFADGKNAASKQSRLTAINLKGDELKGWGGDTRLDAREISLGGGMIAFATGAYGGWRVHVGELGKRPPNEIRTPDIRIGADKRVADVKVLKQAQANEFKLSPDGKKLAFTAGGDVFVMPVEEGGTPRQITDSMGRDRDIDWAPDSKQLCFAAETMGAHNLRTGPKYGFFVQVADLAAGAIAAIESDGGPETHPRFLPDGERLIYLQGDDHLKSASFKGRPKINAIKDNFFDALHSPGDFFDISPDGKWLLYTLPNENYDETLWVANVESGNKRCLLCMFGDSFNARFSRDGKRVDFVCSQNDNLDIYSVDLAQPPVEFKEDKLDKLFKEEKKDEKKEDKPEAKPDVKPDAKPAKTPPATVIDFEGLQKRVRRITSLDGNETWPISTDDGKTFYFIAAVQGQSNVWKLTLDPDKGPDLKQLTQTKSQKSQLRISADEKSLWYLDAGVITDLNLAGNKITPHPFAVEQRRDSRKLREQVFHEATTLMRDRFYDRTMHGVNWRETCDRYRAALESTPTGDEFGSVMNELFGELNSSHQGFTAIDERSDGVMEPVGRLGLEFDPLDLFDGEYRVSCVLRGGPCDLKTAKDGAFEHSVKVGDYLVGVNGKPLERGGVLARSLVATIGRKTTLHFNSKPEFAGCREVAIKPTDRRTEGNLGYQAWVDQNRAQVKALSKGRLGYVHVESMDAPSIDEFRHQLGESALGVEGVVIDVRFNGGGYTAVDLLEILIKRPWLKREARAGGGKVSENVFRSVALEKPSCLLINQSSFSNAEILAEGYRRLAIGKIIGVDTAGGVIGTGAMRLSDGSFMRMPHIGAWTLDGDNLETSGRKPDIYVENTPEDLDHGKDAQLETAVKTLLEDLDKKK
ncbi:MAG: PD40 domain-containing protein [Planctomycetes bacterium]|nr:PD40 domain-containing protein [Planctomycetota bacterium]